MIPQRFAPLLFSLILSGLMSLLVSGIALFRTAGLGEGTLGLWLSAWLAAWPVAFPAVLLVAPLAQKIVRRLVAESSRAPAYAADSPANQASRNSTQTRRRAEVDSREG